MRLRYAIDDRPGISRHAVAGGFVYRRPDGGRIRDRTTLDRIRALAIPPAWTKVWIAPDAHGHLQATGRDARGRKQYRYHAAWTAARDAAKYERLLVFARALPRIRRTVARDLTAPPLSRRRVLATVVSLLERTHMRVGNDEYARDNGSYGLTTLRNRHARVRGPHVEFRFTGKSGVKHVIELDDPRLAREIRRCQELPGQHLFEYRDHRGRIRRVGSADVNAYLTACGGRGITAKDFRTWWGTVSAAILLSQAEPAPHAAAAKRTIAAMIAQVAGELGNTKAVCRKGYIHPDVLEGYTQGLVIADSPAAARARHGLSSEEHAVVALLRRMRTRPAWPAAAVA